MNKAIFQIAAAITTAVGGKFNGMTEVFNLAIAKRAYSEFNRVDTGKVGVVQFLVQCWQTVGSNDHVPALIFVVIGSDRRVWVTTSPIEAGRLGAPYRMDGSELGLISVDRHVSGRPIFIW